MHDPGLVTLSILVLGASAFLLTLISTDAAMVFLIVSMLWSPEIGLGVVQPDRAVVLRLDDFLLGVVFLTWLAKLAINKQLGFLRSTPLNVPLGLFLVSCLVSTGWGILNGSVKNPLASFFYFLKYFEYFFLFFMVVNVVRERRQIALFLKAMFATAVGVSLFGYWQLMVHGTRMRVTAPFEGLHPEPNTLAGYLLLMLAICAGLLLSSPSGSRRLFLLGMIGLMLPPFVYTYSRSGYAAFLVMYLTLCMFSKRHKPLLFALLVLGGLAVQAILPQTVFERVAETFDPSSAVTIGGLGLSLSPAYRLMMWQVMFDRWMQHPLLGFGVSGIGFFVDGQYLLVLGELGLTGLAIFLWIRWKLLKMSYAHYRTLEDPLAKGISLGFLAALVGLLLFSFGGNVFIIVRIMEPFWFLAAMVMVLPQVMAPEPAPVPSAGRPPPGLIPARMPVASR